MHLLKSRTISRITSAITLFSVTSAMVILCGCNPASAPVDNSCIKLLTPKGGETFHVGDTLKVTWELQGKGFDEITAVDIELSPDNGVTWGIFLSVSSIFRNSASWGTYSWKIPATYNFLGTIINLENNSKCLLRVEQYSTKDPDQITVMKAPFTILP